MTQRFTAFLYPLGTLVAMVMIWYAAVKLFHVPSYLLPLPGAVFDRIREDLGFLLYHSWITTYVTLGGFLLSIVAPGQAITVAQRFHGPLARAAKKDASVAQSV